MKNETKSIYQIQLPYNSKIASNIVFHMKTDIYILLNRPTLQMVNSNEQFLSTNYVRFNRCSMISFININERFKTSFRLEEFDEVC